MAETEKIKEIDESEWGTAMKRKFRNFPRGLASSWNVASLRAWKILAHSFDFSFPPHSQSGKPRIEWKTGFPSAFYISINKYKFFFLTQEKHFTTAFRCVSNKKHCEERGKRPGATRKSENKWADVGGPRSEWATTKLLSARACLKRFARFIGKFAVIK